MPALAPLVIARTSTRMPSRGVGADAVPERCGVRTGCGSAAQVATTLTERATHSGFAGLRCRCSDSMLYIEGAGYSRQASVNDEAREQQVDGGPGRPTYTATGAPCYPRWTTKLCTVLLNS